MGDRTAKASGLTSVTAIKAKALMVYNLDPHSHGDEAIGLGESLCLHCQSALVAFSKYREAHRHTEHNSRQSTSNDPHARAR